MKNRKQCDIAVIGGAVCDVLVNPAPTGGVTGSVPANVRMSLGGDALNEATVLARHGHCPALVTSLGNDPAADMIRARCAAEGIELFEIHDDAPTGVNVVMVSRDGERGFITNPASTLRRLSLKDVEPFFETEAFRTARIVCLASMFVSPMLTTEDMAALFRRCRDAGKIVCADTTKRKRGETVADTQCALSALDYFFPNMEEARLLTGSGTPDEVADRLLGAGVRNVVLKLGGRGCLIANGDGRCAVPSYPVTRCVDTTGAGDTFASSFQAALLEGRTLRECGAFANAAASLCVEELGATTARMNRAEIARRAEAILRGEV